MKEVQQALKEAQWADDREVTHCKQCEKAFSVSRRKVQEAFYPFLLQRTVPIISPMIYNIKNSILADKHK